MQLRKAIKVQTYQPGIDGLRAIAVLSVLLFHLEISVFSGGYVGVDVFFVISGFLITRLILSEINETGSFRFGNFYARRVKRLFPALAVTLVITLALGYLLFIPEHYERLGASFISAVLSLSNIYFWNEAGYFDVNSDFKPLLHTWSLSVEEQFYIFWPVTLFVLAKYFNKTKVWWIIALMVGSFLLNLSFIDGKIEYLEYIWPRVNETFGDGPSTLFYLTPFRIFEFGIGALAVWFAKSDVVTSRYSELGLLTGIILILYSIFSFDKTTPFPTYNALIPCVGTALCILFHNAPYLGKLLSSRVMVQIGLWSYSIYLVHWPLIIFYQYYTFDSLSSVEQILLIPVTILFAYLMYTFIEQPFRRGTFSLPKLNPTTVLTSVIATALLLSMPAYVVWSSNGIPSRFQPIFTSSSAQKEADAKEFEKQTCEIVENFNSACDMSLPNKILLVGDSHLPAWNYAFNEVIKSSDTQVFKLSYLGCHADFKVTDNAITSEITTNACDQKAKFLSTNNGFLSSVDLIVLTSYRPYSYQANPFRFDLLDYLQKRNPNAKFLIAGNYVQTNPRKPCRMIILRKGDASACTNSQFVEYIGNLEQVSTEPLFNKELSEKYEYIDFASMICPAKVNCPYEALGVPLMFDYNHMTFQFNKFLLENAIKNNQDYFQSVGVIRK